ncbi:MAG: hypothetical protein CYPHOPRED_000946 [Cyphobasidiales sp. Tagirdzhanova-0007]|nr:MAG: hypothetical protein CYPHOPRED_000946 [Cyphobasidiales sp. Tagirdzhanova-0007]
MTGKGTTAMLRQVETTSKPGGDGTMNGTIYADRPWERDVRDPQRVPPPREDRDNGRWERDQYREDRDGPSTSSSYNSSLIRFPSPPPNTRRPNDLREFNPPSDLPTELPQKPRKRIVTPPNQSVILIGIPPQASEEDVKTFVEDFRVNPSDPSPVENITIVRDKQTGASKRFGFVRFITLEHARAFVEANFDHVYWRSREGLGKQLLKPGLEAGPREVHVPTPADLNDGSKDMGSSSNSILLLRNLDPLTKEGDIARSLETLDAQTRKRVKMGLGPRRIILIKDKETNASWCFAFAIYPDEESAKAALRVIIDPASFPTGYTIHQKLVAATFARVGCFTKAYAKTAWSWSEVTPDGKKQELLYWDDHAYGSFFDCPSYEAFLKKKHEEEAKQMDVDAFFSALESEHPKLKPEDEVVKAPPKFDLNLSGLLGPPGASARDKKKGNSELIISKKVFHPEMQISPTVSILAKKAEVDYVEPTIEESAIPVSSARPVITSSTAKSPEEAVIAQPAANILSEDRGMQYADITDPNMPKCLLCQRQFKSLEVLEKHNDQSALHKTNAGDPLKVEAANQLLNSLPSSSGLASTSAYRDRALERREALNQPDHPPPPPVKKHKKNTDLLPKPVVSAPEKSIEETNVGSKLLANMGWTTGSGLGSTLIGRAEPVQAKAFIAGAGIGASKGMSASLEDVRF